MLNKCSIWWKIRLANWNKSHIWCLHTLLLIEITNRNQRTVGDRQTLRNSMSHQQLIKLYRCSCVRNNTKSIFFSSWSQCLGYIDPPSSSELSPLLFLTLTQTQSWQPGSQPSLPPPPLFLLSSLPVFPCSRKQWASLQQHTLWENAWVLGRREGLQEMGEKKEKWSKCEEEKMRPARFKDETYCQMYCMFEFNNSRLIEGWLMSELRHPVKRRFSSDWCLSSKAPEMPVIPVK